MTHEAIILAGGFGSRNRDIENETNSLILVNNKPFIEYQFNYLEFWGIKRIIIACAIPGEPIKNHYGKKFGSIDIDYVNTEQTLGSGGAVKKAIQLIDSPTVFVLNGETLFDVSLRRLFNFKRSKEADVAMAIRFVSEAPHGGSVKIDINAKVIEFKEEADQCGEEYIYGGISCIGTRYFKNKATPDKFSMGRDFIKNYHESDKIFGFKCYSTFIDLATEVQLEKVENEINGLSY